MTYGDLRFRLKRMFPSVDLEIIEGFIADRYAEIMGELPWSRQNVESVLQTSTPYTGGTVSLTNGDTAVTGAGTVFTSAMSGRGFRATGRDEIYEFTYLSGTLGALDRPYEGPTVTGSAYKIFQHVYVLPDDCRMVEEQAFSPLVRLPKTALQLGYGKPNSWAVYMDDASTPPRMQVQLDPIPDAVYSFPFLYSAEAPSISGTSVTLLPWIQPAALVEGVMAKVKAYLRDYVGAAYHEKQGMEALGNMRTSEAQGMAPASLQLGAHYTAHRRRRW